MNKNWHSLSIEEVLQKLKSSKSGLTLEEVKNRIKTYGYNKLEEMQKETPIQLFISQFKNAMIFLLIAAAIISFAIGDKTDAIAISIIIVLNAVIGFFQEYKAEKSLEALKSMTAPEARVIRDNSEIKILARELVPGDIILLEAGDKVPADSRILESATLEIDESALTGESVPVKKTTKEVPQNAPIAERTCMAYMSTVVTSGRGKAIVTETGMNTEIGKIAEMVQMSEQRTLTPLQIKLDQLSKYLGGAAIIISLMVFGVGVLKGMDFGVMFLASISLAVAAVPEGLPAVVTIALAIGMQKMAKRKAIIRKMPAVETLGCATVICSDKTGTLTQNKMTVQKIQTFSDFKGSDGEKLLLQIGVLCNDATLDGDTILGDPTEGAILVEAKKHGIEKQELNRKYPRIGELTFDSKRKRMTTIHSGYRSKKLAYTKGAPESVLEVCNYIYENGKVVSLEDYKKKEILKLNETWANNALRVLAMAYRELPSEMEINPEFLEVEKVEVDLVFVGLLAMKDPAREEVKDSIKLCKRAGIKTVMITGDSKPTAVAIAKELHILSEENKKVLTGADLDKITDKELENIVEDVGVYARTSPEHKMKIVKALKNKKEVVAMTGDGVNDAPALKRADIGVAMGITGTDVSKEASDMVLADDNFATMVSAIEEGRGIYDNIKKFLRFQLSTNIAAILIVFIGILFGWLPLTPMQILWINVIMDGPPALSLSKEPYHDTMNRPPRDPKEKVLTKDLLYFILGVGVLMFIGTILVYAYSLGQSNNFEEYSKYASTMAFTTFVMFQMFNVFNCKSEKDSVFKVGVFSNKTLIYAVLGAISMQVAVVYIPFLQVFFKTVALSLTDWILVLLVSLSVLVAVEIVKGVRNIYSTNPKP
ncbi:MAG: calcium-transporting P-type ATPase, PMR1-type [Methanosarcinales archaeon]